MSPSDIGIVDFETYVPQLYVSLGDLESWDGVSEGKYTVGLGQSEMAVCTEREDVNSMCLTVVKRLMRSANVSFMDIGRIDVGTESLVDKSKSTKSTIMQLFEESGNFSIEGADNLNACYGGTAALFNVIDWMESSAWDGRYGMVVMADIAMYSDKVARPTGGAGAVALLIGKDAKIRVESALRSTYSSHKYDFYKPDMASNYPVVDGKLSVKCYLNALMECYRGFKTKHDKICNEGSSMQTANFDCIIFHSPYSGLVKKAHSLLWAANTIDQSDGHSLHIDDVTTYGVESLSNFDTDRQMQKHLTSKFGDQFCKQVEPTLRFARSIGNSYTASLYMCLVAALASLEPDSSSCKRILAFSYGSGCISSMFSLVVDAQHTPMLRSRAAGLIEANLSNNKRIEITPLEMETIHRHYQQAFTGEVEMTLPLNCISDDQFYLERIDKMKRRFYEFKESMPEGQCNQRNAEFDAYLTSIK